VGSLIGGLWIMEARSLWWHLQHFICAHEFDNFIGVFLWQQKMGKTGAGQPSIHVHPHTSNTPQWRRYYGRLLPLYQRVVAFNEMCQGYAAAPALLCKD